MAPGKRASGKKCYDKRGLPASPKFDRTRTSKHLYEMKSDIVRFSRLGSLLQRSLHVSYNWSKRGEHGGVQFQQFWNQDPQNADSTVCLACSSVAPKHAGKGTWVLRAFQSRGEDPKICPDVLVGIWSVSHCWSRLPRSLHGVTKGATGRMRGSTRTPCCV